MDVITTLHNFMHFESINAIFDFTFFNRKTKLKNHKLRFFSPEELLRLFGFKPPNNIVAESSSKAFEQQPERPQGSSTEDCGSGSGSDGDSDSDKHDELGVGRRNRMAKSPPGEPTLAKSAAPEAEGASLAAVAGGAGSTEVRVTNETAAYSTGAAEEAAAVADDSGGRVSCLRQEEFKFPPGLSSRKCYELIGNSLNVTVVTHLLRYLITQTEPLADSVPVGDSYCTFNH